MKPLLILLLFSGFLSCADNGNNQSNTPQKNAAAKDDSVYKWVKLLDSAGWKKNYNFQMFTVRDTLWVFHPDGCWFSTDGSKWTKSTLTNVINNQAFLDYVVFNNAVYGLGHLEGNIEKNNFSSTIYRSVDFRHWDILAPASNLPNRYFYHPFVFDNKIWIIGGEDKNTQYADIWNSADGINWIKQKDNLPFGKRSNSQVIQFQGKLFLLNNDVWSSADGLNWKEETKEIIKGETVFGYAALVYDDKIWLIGCNRNEQFTSQVFASNDGKNWQGYSAPWLPRGGPAAAVYKDKIFITGGKYGGTPAHTEFRYDNDVWTMEKNKQP